jgi:Tfp pilus assembly protein PilF
MRILPGVFRLVAVSILFVAGCVSVPLPPVSANSAVVALVDGARSDSAAGRHGTAAASLERALRIEPKNPRLWHELARVRLSEGDYTQVESLAARSNSWAGSDNRLRAENWRLIAEARVRRGDDAGARSAIERAEKLER